MIQFGHLNLIQLVENHFPHRFLFPHLNHVVDHVDFRDLNQVNGSGLDQVAATHHLVPPVEKHSARGDADSKETNRFSLVVLLQLVVLYLVMVVVLHPALDVLSGGWEGGHLVWGLAA